MKKTYPAWTADLLAGQGERDTVRKLAVEIIDAGLKRFATKYPHRMGEAAGAIKYIKHMRKVFHQPPTH